MKGLSIILLFLVGFSSNAQDDPSLKELLNHVVGGTWTSTNADNKGTPEDFKSFFMSFENWADDSSVRGSIFGVQNNGDTTELIEIWNFIDSWNKNIFYVHRTTWGAYASGTIQPHEKKHIDIQFKSITPQGQQFFTRDLHYLDGKNEMRAITYHKANEVDEWKEASRSEWKRN